jgi:LacI family transcriptional regulator
MKSTPVTIKDIARELEISPSTVSRALKDHPDISPETKKAVNELAKKLNYTPNAVALSLRKSKTNTIGVIIPEIVHYFFSTIISGIEEIAYDAGYNVMVCQSNESYEREVTDTFALLSSRVDGMIVSVSRETTNFDHLREIKDRGIPLVFFDRLADGIDSSHVIVDDEKGAFNATLHLIEKGYKNIGHIMGPPNLGISKQRLQGYLNALKVKNITPSEDLIFKGSNASLEDSSRIMREVFQRGTTVPDAIFANHDLAAFGAMEVVKEKGLQIPQEFGIVGFSNWQFSAFTSPSLSTVKQPGLEIGRESARLFLNEMEKEGSDVRKITLQTELEIRESSNRIV